MSKWVYLSYEMSESLSNYGNGKGIEIEWIRSMDRGDTSNNSALKLPSHTGTHLDYPFHFYNNGKKGSDYSVMDHVFESVSIIDISNETIQDYLIRTNNLTLPENNKTRFLIIKTGFCEKRTKEEYWNFNWGFAPETAGFLKSKLPSLKAIGFDLISLSSYQQRETGRIAHKEFLEKNDILIIEDMDLSHISQNTIVNNLIVSPLRFKDADGTPVTIFANID